MKEITREDWVKNPTPRMMWVWDDNEGDKVKQFVVCVLTEEEMKEANYSYFPVFTSNHTSWKHCAEIEEKPRRMTRRELAWWLREHPEEHREWKNKNGCVVYGEVTYSFENENEPCLEYILIRSNGGEWHEPLIEVEE